MELELLKETKEYKPFSKDLFFLNRAREFQYSILDDGLLNPILEIQFNAQQSSYKSQYPDARNYIILYKNTPVGKLMVNISEYYHLVDIAIHPKMQNNGIGTQIITNLISEAKNNNKKVKLAVARNNPARNLYHKLGFKIIEEGDVYLIMCT